MTDTIKVGVVVRQGRKVVKSATLPKESIEKLLVEAFQFDITRALLCWPTLKQGNTFKFKLNGYNVTFQPLLNHIDNY